MNDRLHVNQDLLVLIFNTVITLKDCTYRYEVKRKKKEKKEKKNYWLCSLKTINEK